MSWRPSFSVIMVGRRPRWRRCSWRSRPPWRPGRPSTNPAPWPSSAPPGIPRPPKPSADLEAVQTMITEALNPVSAPSPHVDAEWVAATAEKVLAAVEERRSTWQSWHVRAEAQRHVRAADIATDKVDQLVELLVAEVLQTRSISLARPDDGISEPAVLRRSDGSSVYTVAGSELFTSARILAAEQRLVAAGGPHRRAGPGRRHGRAGAAGISRERERLDAGQAALVRAMCTSGARLQLAIAPAGAGKTTAMRTLVRAWSDSGGQVIGLAPSAAAAAQLRDHTGAPAETLAKLTWSIHHNDLPEWAERIGRSSVGDHRRSRDGRHPLPGHRRPVHHRSRWQCSAGR